MAARASSKRSGALLQGLMLGVIMFNKGSFQQLEEWPSVLLEPLAGVCETIARSGEVVE